MKPPDTYSRELPYRCRCSSPRPPCMVSEGLAAVGVLVVLVVAVGCSVAGVLGWWLG